MCACGGGGGKARLGVQLCRWKSVNHRVLSPLTPAVVAAKTGSYRHGRVNTKPPSRWSQGHKEMSSILADQ